MHLNIKVMPELPEVETIVKDLKAAKLEGGLIRSAEVFWSRTVDTPRADLFSLQIRNQQIEKISRRGKFIVFTLNRDTLLLHLRMTGQLRLDQGDPLRGKHERVRLILEDGRVLRFFDQRKFGRFYLLRHPQEFLACLGEEPLSDAFTVDYLAHCLEGRRMKLKPFLLDQSHVCGLGNIYVDEALWEAQLHPLRSVGSLDKSEIQRLHQAIQRVLRRGIQSMGTTLGTQESNYYSVSGRRGRNQDRLKVFRRDGEPCPRCGATITKCVVGQRGTHICPSCQLPVGP